jgi:hypothetical protein
VSRALGAARAAGPGRLRSTALVLVAALSGSAVLAGCAGQEQSGPPAARVATWVSGAGAGASIDTLRVDAANVGQALARHDAPAAVKTVCALLTTDAGTALGNLPTPDTVLTNELNTAYGEAAAAGDDCYAGAGGPQKLLARSAHERARLASLLDTAVGRITTLIGHPPSTSTTTPADVGDPFGG